MSTNLSILPEAMSTIRIVSEAKRVHPICDILLQQKITAFLSNTGKIVSGPDHDNFSLSLTRVNIYGRLTWTIV